MQEYDDNQAEVPFKIKNNKGEVIIDGYLFYNPEYKPGMHINFATELDFESIKTNLVGQYVEAVQGHLMGLVTTSMANLQKRGLKLEPHTGIKIQQCFNQLQKKINEITENMPGEIINTIEEILEDSTPKAPGTAE